MPELPEVETITAGLAPALTHQTIEEVIVYEPRLRWPIESDFAQKLQGQRIQSVQRRAKYIVLSLTSGTVLIHLGMSGRLHLLTENSPLKKHDHVTWRLKNGMYLRYHDPRRFGCMLWTDKPVLEHRLLQHLGPEPLSEAFNAAYLFQQTRHKSVVVKSYIMNAKVVVGVGNIYAAEALFLSQINPYCPVHLLDMAACEHLVSAIKYVLTQAIQQGGTTLKDFVDADGKPGYFAQSLQVYGRGDEPCMVCQNPLISVMIQQRSTVYCQICQRMTT